MPPSRKEIDAIIECASPHIKRAILLTYYTGLRPGKVELLSLTWDSVDLVNRTMMVKSAVKGGLTSRMVPLADAITEKLEQWYDEDAKDGIKYVVHYNGHRVDAIKKAWYAAKKRARITRRLRLYDLRHAFITTLLEKGADLKSVSEMAGHSSPEITMRIYQHVSTQLKRTAIDMLD